MNLRITAKERNLLKGAVRRVFSRSELRLRVLERGRIEHIDPKRPRVTKWNRCESCQQPVASYQVQVDHIIPIVPVDSSLEAMTWDELVDRCWCDEKMLQGLCAECHTNKTKAENAARKAYRNERKKAGK
jgi:5-methylcytosine-specific restriction endonuclease McrA